MRSTRFGWPTPFEGSANLPAFSAFALPFVVTESRVLDKYGIVTTTGGGEFSMAIYTDSGLNAPGSLVNSMGGRQTIGAAGHREVDVSDVLLAPGRHWLVYRGSTNVGAGANPALAERRCVRSMDPSIEAPGPATFSLSSCATGPALNFYVVTYLNP